MGLRTALQNLTQLQKDKRSESHQMQDLELTKRRIQSAEDLSSVTRTMKTIAVVGIRQYEAAAQSLAVYASSIESGLSMVLQSEVPKSLRPAQIDAGTGAIVFGSDHGMCGQFNDQVAQFANEKLSLEGSSHIPLMCVGQRVVDKLVAQGLEASDAFRLPGSAVGIGSLVRDLLPAIDQWRDDHNVGRILIFHNRRETGYSWKPRAVQLLPLPLDRLRNTRREPLRRSLPHWTMPTEGLFSRLVQQFLFVMLFRACAESMAGENASRIAAMQSAERNINDRLSDLRAEYAQQRQTSTTEELMDVVTGFEALNHASP